MEYKFLRFDIENKAAYLLGYRMPLTDSEFKILATLTESITVTGRGMSTSELLGSYSEKVIRPSNITVHICSINKKAKSVGGRRLIIFDDGVYYLNEYM